MAGDSTEKDELQPDVVEKEAEVAAEAGGDLVLASDKEPEAPKASVTESDTAPAEEEAAPVQEKGATKDPVEPVKAAVATKDPVEPAKAAGKGMNIDPMEISSRAASENQKYLLSVAAMGNRRMIDILAQRARKSGGKDQSFQTVSMALSIISSHYADEISKDNFASQYGTMLNCYANLYRACDMYLQGGSQSSSRLRGRGAADMQNTKYAMQAMEVARQDVTTIRNQGPRLAQRAEPISWGRFFGEAAVGALQMDRYARAQMGQRKAQGQQMQSAAIPQNQGAAQGAAQGADAVAQAKALPEGMQFLSGNGSGNSLQLHENSLRSSLEYMGESKIVPKIVVENILGLYASYCVSKKDGDHVGMRLSERLIMVQCTRAPKSAVLAQLSRDCGMAMERRLEEQDEQFASNEKLSKGMDKVTGVTPEQVKKMCDTVRALERGRKEGISNEEQMKLLEFIVNDVGASPMRAAGKHVGLLVKQCQRMLHRMKNPKAPPPSKSSVPSKEAASTSSSDSTKSESSAKDVSKEIAKVASDDTAKDASEEVAKVASDDSAKVASEEVAKDASDTTAKDASEGAGEQKKEPEKAAEATTKLKALPEGMQFLSKNGSGNTIKFNGGMLYACLGHMGETKIVPRVVIENILEMYARYCVYRAEGDQMGMRHAAKLISIQCSRVSKKSAVLAQLAKDCDTAIERRSEGQNEKSVSKEKLAKAMDTGNDTAKDASADTAKSVSEDTAKDAGKDAGKDTGKDAGKDAGAQKKEPEKAAEVATKPKKLPEGIQFLSGKGSGNKIQFNETGLRYCLKYMGESKMVSAPVMENILGLLARYYLHQMDGDRTGMRVTERLISIQCSRVPKSTVLTQLAKDCETATERRREEEDEQFASDEKLSKGMDTAAGVTPEQVKEMCDAVRALERGRKENMSSEEQIKLLEYIVNDVGASPMRTMKHVGPLVKQCQRILQRMKNSKAPPPSTSSAPGKEAASPSSSDNTKSESSAKDVSKDIPKVAKDATKDGGKDTAEGTTEEATDQKAKSAPEWVGFLTSNRLVVTDYWLRDCIKMAGETEIVPEVLIGLLGERFREYNAIQNTGTHEDLRFIEWTIEGMCKKVPESTVLAKLSKDCKVAKEYRQEKKDETFISSDKLKNGSLRLWVERGWLSPEIVQNLCDNVRKLEGGQRYGMDPQEKIKLINEIIEVCESCPQRDLTYVKEQCERILDREKKREKKSTVAKSSAPS